MNFRHAVLAAVFVFHGFHAAAALEAEDASAFHAILNDRFHGPGTILVGDTTRGSFLPGTLVRSEQGVPVGGWDPGHVRLVPTSDVPTMLRGTAATAAFIFHTPVADAQKGTVRVEYELAVPELSHIRFGAGVYTLRSEGRGWAVVDKQESLPSIDPWELPAPPALRVGGDVKAPALIAKADPVYTEEAKQAGIRGIVILEAIIDAEGRVIGAKVLKPLPMGLDRAAVDAMMKWRFRPGTLGREPVSVVFNLTVLFKEPKPAAVDP